MYTDVETKNYFKVCYHLKILRNIFHLIFFLRRCILRKSIQFAESVLLHFERSSHFALDKYLNENQIGQDVADSISHISVEKTRFNPIIFTFHQIETQLKLLFILFSQLAQDVVTMLGFGCILVATSDNVVTML